MHIGDKSLIHILSHTNQTHIFDHFSLRVPSNIIVSCALSLYIETLFYALFFTSLLLQRSLADLFVFTGVLIGP